MVLVGNNIIEAIGNCRVSSDEQLKSNSLPRQKQAIEEMANKLGAKLVYLWSGSVSSKKGKNIDRSDLLEMLDYCKKHRSVKYAIFDEPDRFVRSMFEMGYYFVEFDKLDVKIRFASKSELDSESAIDKLLIMLEAFKAEGSNEERQQKCITGHTKALQEGRYPYPPILGYQKGNDRAIHKVIPELGPILKSILMRLSAGLIDLKDSLAELNATAYFQTGKHCKLKMDKWRRIVVNPYYAGVVEMHRQVNYRNEHGLHEALITLEQHYKIVDIINDKKKAQKGPIKGGNPRFLLNKITFCEQCYITEQNAGKSERSNKAKYVGFDASNGKTPRVYSRYRCRKCGKCILRDNMHSQVTELLSGLDFSNDKRKIFIKALNDVWKVESVTRIADITARERELSNLNRQRDTLVDSFSKAKTEVMRSEIENKLEKIGKLMDEKRMELDRIVDSEGVNREHFMSFALEFVDNLGSHFFELSSVEAHKCKLLLFPDGFFVNAENKVYTPTLSPFYGYRLSKNAPEGAVSNFMVRVKRL